jgi:hypothetical protein
MQYYDLQYKGKSDDLQYKGKSVLMFDVRIDNLFLFILAFITIACWDIMIMLYKW